AAALEKRLGARDDVELVLVSKENYFVFQPMLPEVIGATIGVTDLVRPLTRLLPRTELHVRDVMGVDLAARTVTTAPGFQPHPHVLPFDHLVLALGNVTDFRGLRGLAEHALPFKNLQDALEVRNRVIRSVEEAAIEQHDPRLREELLTFVVAGGGFSGVEVVAELNDFARGIARRFPSLDPRESRVVLVHSQDRILPEVTEKLGRFAERILRERGVEIALNTRLDAATGAEAPLADGRRIPTRTLGSRSAVAEIGGIPVSGVLAWFLWRTIYLLKLPGWGRRAKVAASWTFDLFLPPDLVQFRFAAPPVMRREHYEPGQEVFHEGDLGDRIYTILRGSAEVVRGDRAIARLGPGDLFGEMALLVEQGVRSATVRCIEPLDVWSLPRRDLDLLAQGLPDVRRNLAQLRGERLPVTGT